MREPKDITILIVDDEEGLRNAMIFDFKRRGFNVVGAENGSRAFEIVQTQPVDVVLTDVRMPGGDGIELLDKIKAANYELPVVMFITGFADITLEEAYDKGVNAVFSKPFDRKALLAAVVRVTTGRDERWSAGALESVETDFNIELVFPDLNLAVNGRLLNIGRGGMFVALNESFPRAEARTSFNIRFSGDAKVLQGSGIVKWIRLKEMDGRPSGCGIEFEYLNDQSRAQVLELINTLKTKAFIPRT